MSAEAVAGLIRTLERLYAERGITITPTIDPAHAVQGQREDLEEMLGNLLDNACKWAQDARRRRVHARDAGASW